MENKGKTYKIKESPIIWGTVGLIRAPQDFQSGPKLNIEKKSNIMKIYVYFKNGNVYEYEVASAEKAREHAEKIWTSGYRVKVGDRHEWFGPHYIDKICWDGLDDTYLGRKYGE